MVELVLQAVLVDLTLVYLALLMVALHVKAYSMHQPQLAQLALVATLTAAMQLQAALVASVLAELAVTAVSQSAVTAEQAESLALNLEAVSTPMLERAAMQKLK
jgi:hypothetical protein